MGLFDWLTNFRDLIRFDPWDEAAAARKYQTGSVFIGDLIKAGKNRRYIDALLALRWEIIAHYRDSKLGPNGTYCRKGSMAYGYYISDLRKTYRQEYRLLEAEFLRQWKTEDPKGYLRYWRKIAKWQKQVKERQQRERQQAELKECRLEEKKRRSWLDSGGKG